MIDPIKEGVKNGRAGAAGAGGEGLRLTFRQAGYMIFNKFEEN
jgi:hypothetical protein